MFLKGASKKKSFAHDSVIVLQQLGNCNFLLPGVNVETARQNCYRMRKNVAAVLKFMHARRPLLMQ